MECLVHFRSPRCRTRRIVDSQGGPTGEKTMNTSSDDTTLKSNLENALGEGCLTERSAPHAVSKTARISVAGRKPIDILLSLREAIDLFHTAEGQAFANVKVNG